MTITEVLNANTAMKRIKRKIWNTDFCTIPMSKSDHLYYCDEYHLNTQAIYQPSIDDLTATDWMNFDE